MHIALIDLVQQIGNQTFIITYIFNYKLLRTTT